MASIPGFVESVHWFCKQRVKDCGRPWDSASGFTEGNPVEADADHALTSTDFLWIRFYFYLASLSSFILSLGHLFHVNKPYYFIF